MLFGKPIPPLLVKTPTNLEEWLDAATREIVPAAQARIRTEIEAHYAEAVRVNVEQGMTTVAAHAAALAALGDADAARFRFCQEHLTTWDSWSVGVYTMIQIFLGIVFIVGLSVSAFARDDAKPSPLDVLLIMVFFFVLLPALFFFIRSMVRRSRPALTPRLMRMMLALAWLNMGAYVVMQNAFNAFGHHRREWIDTIILVVMALIGIFSMFSRLNKKLASARENGFPPSPLNAPRPPGISTWLR